MEQYALGTRRATRPLLVVLRWCLRLICRLVASQYNYLHGVASPAAVFEVIPAHQRRTPSLIECQPGQESKGANKGLLHCLVLPTPSTVSYGGMLSVFELRSLQARSNGRCSVGSRN